MNYVSAQRKKIGNILEIFWYLKLKDKFRKTLRPRYAKIRLRLEPGRTGQIFVYFAKKSVTSSLRQVRPVIFRSTKFCQGLPNFKDAIVLPQSRTNFCQV